MGYVDSTATWPGKVMLIWPPQVHTHLQSLVRAAMLLIFTATAPGTHGATVTGTHGMGEPRAAMTVGLLGEVHMPKGGMLAIGMKSITVPAMAPPALTMPPFGIGMNDDGATPNEHIIMAPCVTFWPMDPRVRQSYGRREGPKGQTFDRAWWPGVLRQPAMGPKLPKWLRPPAARPAWLLRRP